MLADLIKNNPFLIPVIIFEAVKLVLWLVDFFYRNCTFRGFLTFLLPIAKLFVFSSALLGVKLQGKLEIESYIVLLELLLAQFAFLSTVLRGKGNRDNLYLFFTISVIVLNTVSAKSFGFFNIWEKAFHTAKEKIFFGNGF